MRVNKDGWRPSRIAMIMKRFMAFTNTTAKLAATGQSPDEAAAGRGVASVTDSNAG